MTLKNNTSYPTIRRMFDRLFYGHEDGEIHWMWKEGISVQYALKDEPEALKLFLDLYYDGSPTTKIKLEKKYAPLNDQNQIQCVYCGAIGSHICLDGCAR